MPPFFQLSPSGAVVPYGICLDSENCVWVAAKGGVFRYNESGECLFSEKYDNPKQINAFSAIRCISASDASGNERILVKYGDENGCFLVLYDFAGNRLGTSILDHPVKNVAITENGDIFLTSQPNTRKSDLLRGHVDDLTSFDPIVSSTEFQFDQLCWIEEKRFLVVSCARVPSNPYSDQHLSVYDFDGRKVSVFSRNGKEDGEVYWPRAMEVTEKGTVIILDKTGRLQEFDPRNGNFVRLIETIPAGLGNGFCIDKKRNRILVTCSGLVFGAENGRAECNDWIESIPAKF